MKRITHSTFPIAFCLLLGLFCPAPLSFAASNVDRVQLKEGSPEAFADGEWSRLKEELELTPRIKVLTNGTFTVNGGKPRELKEGQVLRKDAMLLNPDGTLRTVLDHFIKDKGKVMIYKDGVGSPLTAERVLPGGARITPDGAIRLPNGRLHRMIDGQMMELDGAVIPSEDTVTLREGTVYVQKDGAQFTLKKNQIIVMNDGSRVHGDGRLVKPGQSEIRLTDGQIVTLPGAVFTK